VELEKEGPLESGWLDIDIRDQRFDRQSADPNISQLYKFPDPGGDVVGPAYVGLYGSSVLV
jgi:hypothetical protein